MGRRSGWVVQSVKKLVIYQALLGVLKQKVVTYQANGSLSISRKVILVGGLIWDLSHPLNPSILYLKPSNRTIQHV